MAFHSAFTLERRAVILRAVAKTRRSRLRELQALSVAVASECLRRLIDVNGQASSVLDPDLGPETFFEDGMRAYIRFGIERPAWYELMFGSRFAFDAYPNVKEAVVRAFVALEAGVSIALHGLVDLQRVIVRRSSREPLQVTSGVNYKTLDAELREHSAVGRMASFSLAPSNLP